ncbi:hypothetical protein RUMGNA_02001 [Mediterraneibacter gnavus ATCC 29149]|uniref:Uncharacterized protein n=1 Tax=Mediterraneibacter gnavus (strain ATCC 29149 / DSM 114966 / JCM 6515 / VPI C7-9) TaxID=411470 RepID=A7B373_MEDG7|nr:hypothetical protein RUMGNA_02001 [Mediterraneibacter gnavus ATCC 29149]
MPKMQCVFGNIFLKFSDCTKSNTNENHSCFLLSFF